METPLAIALLNRWQNVSTATELRVVATIPYADGSADSISLEFEAHEDYVLWQAHDSGSTLSINTIYAGPAAVAARLLKDIKALGRGLPVLASLVLEAAGALEDISSTWGWNPNVRIRPTEMRVAHLDPVGTGRGLCVIQGYEDGLYAGWFEHARDRITVDLRPGLSLADALATRQARAETLAAALTMDDHASSDDLMAAGRHTPGLAILSALHHNCVNRLLLRTTAQGSDHTGDLMDEIQIAMLMI